MKKFRIGIECESIEDPETWGIGRMIKQLLKELAQRPELGNEFEFFLYFKRHIPDYDFLRSSLFVKRLIKPVVFPTSFSLYYYWWLPLRLYSEKLDLMYFPNYMLPLIFRGRSLVMLTEDIYYEIKVGQLPLKYRLAYRIFAGWAAKRATKIMAISETSKQNLTKLFEINPKRIAVNHLGVNLPPATSNQRPATGKYLLYVGQAFPRRHLKETMLAFEQIASVFPGYQLIAVGKDKYHPPIINQLTKEINERLGETRIIYKPYVGETELAQLYQKAELSIYISSREAFGLPPLEALAYQVPPVVTDNPLSRELLGQAGFFVSNPDSIENIAATLTEALTDSAKIQAIRSQALTIAERYSWKAHADRFIEIVRKTA